MKRTCVVVASLLVALTACKKNETQQGADSLTLPPITNEPGTTQSVTAANNRGELDSLGQWHNEGMNYVYKSMLQYGYTTLDKASALTAAYAKLKLKTNITDQELYSKVTAVANDAPKRFQRVIASFPVSAEGRAAFQRLINAVQDTTLLSGSPYYQTLKNRFVQFELDVEKGNLPAGEKTWLLQSSAIARYSLLYGITLTADPVGPAVAFRIKNIIKIMAMSVQDVVSFASSAIGGGDIKDAVASSIDGSAYAGTCITYFVPLP